MTKTKISVIIPVYNSAPWLDDALKSVITNQDKFTEIIIVDDGSTDGSYEIAEAATKGRPSTQLIKNSKNEGIVYSLNRALDAAQGEYIARMDADDICMKDRFNTQLKYLEQNELDLCGSWFIEFGQGPSRIARWPHSEAAVRAALLFQNVICHPTIMAKRHLFERLRYRKAYQLAEDYDLFSRALIEFRVANLPQPLLRYRRHPKQATQSKLETMEKITKTIRLQALRSQGISFNSEEARIHNIIRAPVSITTTSDLEYIEKWLIKLLALHVQHEARLEIASQWLRACIRAAPLGSKMREIFWSSNLVDVIKPRTSTKLDLYALSILRLQYGSKLFSLLRRLGLSS